MFKCPNCGSEIKYIEVLFRKLDKSGCPNCGVHLKRKRWRGKILIGGISGALTGGTEGYLMWRAFLEHFSYLSILYCIIDFIVCWVLSITFLFLALPFDTYEIIQRNK